MEDLRTNAKHLSQEGQYQIRRSVIRMLEREYKPEQIMEALDVSRSFVYATKKAYNERGIEGIKPGKRGRRAGAKRTLTCGTGKRNTACYH